MILFVLVGLLGITLFVLLGVSICYWIYSDASSRGINFPLLWAVGSMLSGILGIYYLLICRRSTDRSPSSPRERLALTVVFAEVGALILATQLNGAPDPVSMVIYWIAVLVPLFPISYFLVYQKRYKQLSRAI